MSIRLMGWAMDTTDVEGSTFLVLLVLCDHANEDGRCWPTVKRVARRAHVSRATVHRVLPELERLGYLSVDRAPGQPSTYRLFPSHVQAVDAVENFAIFEDDRAQSATPPRPDDASDPTGTALTVATQNHQGTVMRPNARGSRDSATLGTVHNPRRDRPPMPDPVPPDEVAQRVDELRTRLRPPEGQP